MDVDRRRGDRCRLPAGVPGQIFRIAEGRERCSRRVEHQRRPGHERIAGERSPVVHDSRRGAERERALHDLPGPRRRDRLGGHADTGV